MKKVLFMFYYIVKCARLLLYNRRTSYQNFNHFKYILYLNRLINFILLFRQITDISCTICTKMHWIVKKLACIFIILLHIERNRNHSLLLLKHYDEAMTIILYRLVAFCSNLIVCFSLATSTASFITIFVKKF